MKARTVISRPRRAIAICAAATCLVVLFVTVALAEGGRSHAAAHPRLLLVRTAPITVRGTRFARHSRVTVTLTVARMATGRQTRQTQRVRANSAGGFTVTFSAGGDRCTAWSVRATQGGHSAVAFVRGPKPECAPMSMP